MLTTGANIHPGSNSPSPMTGTERRAWWASSDPLRSAGILRTGHSIGWMLTLNAQVESVGRAYPSCCSPDRTYLRLQAFDGAVRVPRSALQR